MTDWVLYDLREEGIVLAEQRTMAEIEEAIAELKRRWPAHSVPAAMIERLEALEDELIVACEEIAHA